MVWNLTDTWALSYGQCWADQNVGVEEAVGWMVGCDSGLSKEAVHSEMIQGSCRMWET